MDSALAAKLRRSPYLDRVSEGNVDEDHLSRLSQHSSRQNRHHETVDAAGEQDRNGAIALDGRQRLANRCLQARREFSRCSLEKIVDVFRWKEPGGRLKPNVSELA